MNFGMNVNINDIVLKMNDEAAFLYKVELVQYEFIDNLVAVRKSKSLTQKDVASTTGMTQQAISRLEKYGSQPTLASLIKYMKAIGLDINSIFEDI